MMAAISYTVSFAHVCQRLGIADRPRSWQVKHLAHLQRSHGFPAALPARWAVNSRSWDSRAVDHWFDSLLSPAACQQAQAALTEVAADLLDARASEFAGKQKPRAAQLAGRQPERIHA